MNNTTLQLKIKQRLNKLASNDYDNIECWQIVEAFNKAQVEWCRRNIHGLNVVQEGDEQSTRRIDDLQILINTQPLTVVDKLNYFEAPVPANYFDYKRVSIKGKNDCCDERDFVVYLADNGNLDLLLRDKNKRPSFDWAETFCTLKDNKIQIYTNNEFEITSASLTYYRQPIKIQIEGCTDPYLSTAAAPVISATEVPCEFKDDVVELFIDETVKIIAGDIESFNQYQRAQQAVENNN